MLKKYNYFLKNMDRSTQRKVLVDRISLTIILRTFERREFLNNAIAQTTLTKFYKQTRLSEIQDIELARIILVPRWYNPKLSRFIEDQSICRQQVENAGMINLQKRDEDLLVDVVNIHLFCHQGVCGRRIQRSWNQISKIFYAK